MSTPFDPNAFLDLEINESFEKRSLVPAGDYPAEIQELTPVAWESKDKRYDSGPKAGQLKSGVRYDVKLNVLVPTDVLEAAGLKSDFKLVLTDGIMVDQNDAGGLDTSPGANRGMRNYREALDMNKPGVTFRPREMVGRMLLVRVKHEEYPLGSGNFSEKPNGVAPLAG